METLRSSEKLLEKTWVYRLWQAPFADAKWAPVARHNDLSRVQRVLDVGCGPGTNTRHFLDKDYLGIDINEDYIAYARGKYGKDFVAADVTRWQSPEGRFDFILLNSFLHHIDESGCRDILQALQRLLGEAGTIHVLDLVLPEKASVARWLARADRGEYARPLDRWLALMSDYFEPTLFEPYSMDVLGVDLWKMVYFRGSLPSSS